MQKIILFYKFVRLSDPLAIKLWQLSLVQQYNLRGRIIVAKQGINGTIGGEITDLKSYIKAMKNYPSFKDIVYKWSDGSKEDFPKANVKLKDELVAFKLTQQPKINNQGIVGNGIKLKPVEVNQLYNTYPDQVVFFDGRNKIEATIGRFKDAVVLDVEHTRDFKDEITKADYDYLKNKKVITYCTGGVRCEVLSKMLLDQGFQEVYQIDGGIVKYLEQYQDKGLFQGSLYVFDKRLSIDYGSAEVISRCSICNQPTKNLINCANLACNNLVLVCETCASEDKHCLNCQKASVLN